jgi:Transposase/DDE superfamily endonuclease
MIHVRVNKKFRLIFLAMKAKPRGPELSSGTRRVIVAMHKCGKRFADIGRELGIPSDTVRKVWTRRESNPQGISAPRSGRPPKLTVRDRRRIVRYVRSDPQKRREPLADISLDLNLGIHPNTIRHVLKEAGMNHRIQRKRPYLTKEQKHARLEFAKKHVHWTIEDWRRVIFTDEMGMQTGGNVGQVWVWRYPEEEYMEDCCGVTHISGFKKIKVWGAMRYDKLSKLIVLPEKQGDGKLKAEEYCEEILDKELFDFWQTSMEELGCVVVMEDGAPYHKGPASVRRRQYEEDGWIGWGPGIWPANSPDLNPIENVWHILETNVRKREPRPMKKEDLKVALKEEWRRLDMDKIRKLIEGMPRRMKKVIAAKGGSTDC